MPRPAYIFLKYLLLAAAAMLSASLTLFLTAGASLRRAHLAVLLRALEEGNMPQISAALRDRLHQPYRISLIDEYEDVGRIACKNGCAAVCISGAGPTVLCLTQDPRFAEAMRAEIRGLAHRWQVRDLKVDAQGAHSILNK